jgi:hypothetical protein
MPLNVFDGSRFYDRMQVVGHIFIWQFHEIINDKCVS